MALAKAQAAAAKINIDNLKKWIEKIIALVGPFALPLIEAYINTLPIPQAVKDELDAFIAGLLNPAPVPTP